MLWVDWSTRVINIPKADLTDVGNGRYELHLYDLHKWLKDIEDNADGMVNPDTHEYTKPLQIGGTVLARAVEIINGYTVTFENGAYLVDIVGGNSNVLDVLNFNNVSVRANNSGGLVEVGTGGDVNVVKVNGTPIDSLTDIAEEVWGYEIQ